MSHLDEHRMFVHPSWDCSSMGDWTWCSKCDKELTTRRDFGREMCVHTGFLAVKSCQANHKSCMFVGGSGVASIVLLSRNFNVDGTKAEAALARPSTALREVRRDAPPPTETTAVGQTPDELLARALEEHRIKMV